MKKITKYQLITILATLVTIIVNGLANALPINGQGTGEISDRFAIYFVPAGYVFSIWGLIYAGLIAYTIYQALPAQRENALIKKISPAYWIGSLANAVWIFLWHYEVFPLTLVVMIVILMSLLMMYTDISRSKNGMNKAQKLLVGLPFSVYLGWITVATVANVSQVLYILGWKGFGIAPAVWAVIMLAVAALLGLLMLLQEKDIPYVLVLVWAFIGIALKHAAVGLVGFSAWLLSAVLVIAAAVSIFLPNNQSAKSK